METPKGNIENTQIIWMITFKEVRVTRKDVEDVVSNVRWVGGCRFFVWGANAINWVIIGDEVFYIEPEIHETVFVACLD